MVRPPGLSQRSRKLAELEERAIRSIRPPAPIARTANAYRPLGSCTFRLNDQRVRPRLPTPFVRWAESQRRFEHATRLPRCPLRPRKRHFPRPTSATLTCTPRTRARTALPFTHFAPT